MATAGAGDRRPGRPVDSHRVLRVLIRARWWLLAALVGGGLAGFVLVQWVLPRTWVAVGSLVYEGVPEVPGIPSPGETEVPTMVDSVKLPANLREVRERVHSDRPLDVLGERIDVSVEADSNVMNVTARDSSPEDAAALANATIDVFLAHRVEVERRRLSEHLDVLHEDIRLGRAALDQARERYDAFRHEHGISDVATEQSQAIEAAADLRAQADMARAEAEAEEARLQELQQAVRQTDRTVVTEVQTASPESAELARVRAELAQAQASLAQDHPRVQALQHRVAALEARVASAGRSVHRTVSASPGFEALEESVHGSSANRQAARQREQALEALAASARERIQQLTEIEGQASTLLSAVRVAEQHSSELQVRERALMDALRSPSSGFRIVSQAMPPEDASDGAGRWGIAAAVPFVLVVLVLVLFGIRELRGFKVVTPVEVGYWGNGPVLGATTWPLKAHGLHELVSELDDYFPEAAGSTLVVGATEHEERYARHIADRLRDDWQPTITVAQAVSTPPPAERPGEGTALAVRASGDALAIPTELDVTSYSGDHAGPRFRRAVRLADRVVVVVESGRHSAVDLAKLRARIGRLDMRVGFVVVNLPDELRELPDRAGDVEEFWGPPPPKASVPPGEAA